MDTDYQSFAEAAHNGYAKLNGSPVHHRRIEIRERYLLVIDRIQGTGTHSVGVFFHFRPNVAATVQLDEKLVRQEVQSDYCAAFRRRVPASTVIGRWEGACPVEFTCRIPLD